MCACIHTRLCHTHASMPRTRVSDADAFMRHACTSYARVYATRESKPACHAYTRVCRHVMHTHACMRHTHVCLAACALRFTVYLFLVASVASVEVEHCVGGSSMMQV